MLKLLYYNESAKFEKNLQKISALFCELKETILFSFKDIIDCFPPLEGIPRDFKFCQNSSGYSCFLQFFLQRKFFLDINYFLSKSFAHLK